jgi:hypothetical protein
MKNIITITLFTICSLFLFTSCETKKETYPKYSLTKVEYVPDSLKVEYRTWITETIRAASEHMSGGDYENINQTIVQAKWTADELFEVSVIGLRKQINDDHLHDLYLSPSELSKYELKVLDSLKGK